MNENPKTFLNDAVDLVSLGSHSLEHDDFSDCFKPVPQFILNRSGAFYVFSFIIRYFILFPVRLICLLFGISLITIYFLFSVYLNSKKHLENSFLCFFKLFIFIFNCHIKHVGNKILHKKPHIYVSNHTSFIDYVILSSYKFPLSCISESHGGLFGFIFNSFLSKNGCIAFKRSEKQERDAVIKKIKAHISANNSPMLIFPEGTCVNNNYITLFQKGAFELNATICPVAIKYSKIFMDPYWNRRIHDFTSHLFYLITRWRIDAEIYWIDPIDKSFNETPVHFGHRVKNVIAAKIGLKNTLWNGYFKSSPVLKDREMFKEAMKITYIKLKYHINAFDKEEDSKKNRFYFEDKSLYIEDILGKVYFQCFSYKFFINECCKEYLRLKESEKDINILMERIENKRKFLSKTMVNSN